MYLVKTPSILKPIARDFTWNIKTEQKEIYLTFDDGPLPGITDVVLDMLHSYDAKATFFCLGKNVEANPELYQRLLREGHTTGNHSWDHADGWKTTDLTYFKNVMRASTVIDSKLFRPPYGRITLSQARTLKSRFQLVMWSVISADFDQSVTPEKCAENVVNNLDYGNIIVFHDSEKAKRNMLFALQHTLEFCREEGITLRAIEQQ